jgi:hypothetical protein
VDAGPGGAALGSFLPPPLPGDCLPCLMLACRLALPFANADQSTISIAKRMMAAKMHRRNIVPACMVSLLLHAARCGGLLLALNRTVMLRLRYGDDVIDIPEQARVAVVSHLVVRHWAVRCRALADAQDA